MTDKMNDNELDRLFREKLAGEEATPPAFTWSRIEQELSGPSRRPGALYWWLSGTLVLLIGAAAWWFFTPGASPEKPLAENRSTGTPAAETTAASTGTPSLVTAESKASSGRPASAQEEPTVASSAFDQPSAERQVAAPGKITETAAASSNKKTTAAASSARPKQHAQQPERNPVSGEDHSAGIVKQPVTADNPATGKAEGEWVTAPGTKKQEEPVSAAKTPATDTAAALKNMTEPVAVTPHPADSIPSADSTGAKQPVTDLAKTDSTGSPELPPGSVQAGAFPAFFVGFHGGVDNQRMSGSSRNTYLDKTNVQLYGGEASPVVTTQTYSWGGRFGWFLNKHFSLLGGAYFNMFEVRSPGHYFKFNHNDEMDLNIHALTGTVQLSSEEFSYEDSYMQSDTFDIRISSLEKCSFFNFQFGGAFYPLRTRYFGAYVNLLSNGALLTQQQITLTSDHSGKTFGFDGEDIAGMNRFTLGGQTGLGVEFTPIRPLGIWVESAYFFSGVMNRENAFYIRPSGMRFQAGLMLHF